MSSFRLPRIRKSYVFGIAFVVALALPFSFSPTQDSQLTEGCAESVTTCCIHPLSGCPGVGRGYYDTGMCGQCGDLHPC